jgi:hypothetical protein
MTEPSFQVCPYCGTLPPPLALQREDGTMTEPSDHADQHAPDCPYFLPTVQPRRVGGPTLF